MRRVSMAAVTDLHRVLRPGEFPGIAEPQPFVRELDLVAVYDLLVEDAVFVAYAVAVSGMLKVAMESRKHAGEPAEAGVAEAGVLLALAQLFHVEPHLFQGFLVSSSRPRFSIFVPRRRPIRNSSEK